MKQMGWGHDSSSRMQDPEFKPQYHQEIKLNETKQMKTPDPSYWPNIFSVLMISVLMIPCGKSLLSIYLVLFSLLFATRIDPMWAMSGGRHRRLALSNTSYLLV
jgi:hypothetical protein